VGTSAESAASPAATPAGVPVIPIVATVLVIPGAKPAISARYVTVLKS
jgi:hypothetical protein